MTMRASPLIASSAALCLALLSAATHTAYARREYALGDATFEAHLRVTSSTRNASAPFGLGGDASHTKPSLKDICDDSVEQEAGYYVVDGTRDLNMFYWFFESRGDPAKDPIILWMTGGPGCSDATALFEENGPCRLPSGASRPERNEYSWNTRASVIYIDQPCGVGYSYGAASDEDKNEAGVAKHVGNFLLEFFDNHPELQSLELFITGESYGGHYVPAVADAVRGSLPLRGVAIGNGLTVPEIQFEYYPEMAYKYAKKVLGEPVISYPTYLAQRAGWPTCQRLIQRCQNDTDACGSAQRVCQALMFAPYTLSGKNPYNIELACEKQPLCYDFTNLDEYMNAPQVKEALGVPPEVEWQDCNQTVNAMFYKDWMRNFDAQIVDLLSHQVDVVIYAGDLDFICNWLGNKAWTLAMDWEGKEAFNDAEDEQRIHHDGTPIGEVRTTKPEGSGRFSFFRIFDAGHLAPMDQPKVTLHMIEVLTGERAPNAQRAEAAVRITK